MTDGAHEADGLVTGLVTVVLGLVTVLVTGLPVRRR